MERIFIAVINLAKESKVIGVDQSKVERPQLTDENSRWYFENSVQCYLVCTSADPHSVS